MSNALGLEVINILKENEFCTSRTLTQKLSIGEKSLRGIIAELNSSMNDFAAIESKRGAGYRLLIYDYDMFGKWKNTSLSYKKSEIPSTANERVEFLVLFFLNQQDYVKREKICDFLYVSEKTVTNDLKRIEYILSQYNIQLEKKTHHGMKVQGEEFSKRQCIMNHYLSEHSAWRINEQEIESTKYGISQVVLKVFEKSNWSLSELQFRGLIDYLYVTVHRIKRGFCITNTYEDVIDNFEVDIVEELLTEMIANGFQIENTSGEKHFLGMYLKGNRVVNPLFNGTTNIRIPEYIAALTEEMLQSVYQKFGVDFLNNFDLQMYMNKHLNALEIRLKYGIELKNPILDMVKEKYLYEFILAEQACTVLAKKYGKKLSDDEIAYFALLFAVENEKQLEKNQKKKVLLVCVTGKTSSRFLQMTLKQRFEEYISKIDLCSLYDLKTFKVEDYDYIFSTVPIDQSVSIPIVMVHEFLKPSELEEVQKTLEQFDYGVLRKYYKKELFFTNLTGTTKEEIIMELCQKINKVNKLPKNFYQSVIDRENLGSTDFGNLIAIPHPYEKMLDKDLVCIGVLENPILWNRNQVQVVILSAITEGMSEEAKQFFKVTSTLISKIELVDRIINKKTFSELEKCINLIVEQNL